MGIVFPYCRWILGIFPSQGNCAVPEWWQLHADPQSFHPWPWSATASFAWPLMLHQTLQEQGIEGRNATLSRTLVPTDLYVAWCYVQGMQASEEHFALEGLTQMQVRRFGEHVYHLARSLKNISFDNVFTTSLSPYRVTLPNNLQSLTFGNDFNQSLDRVPLPSNLQSLTFSNHFNQSLDRVTLPNKLQSLTFGNDFNQSLNGVALPNSLQSLTFGVRFNQSLDRVTLSSSLKSLTFGYYFN